MKLISSARSWKHLGVCEEMTPVENIPPVSISEKNYEPNEDGWPQ
jgi:hypothetical protein